MKSEMPNHLISTHTKNKEKCVYIDCVRGLLFKLVVFNYLLHIGNTEGNVLAKLQSNDDLVL